MFWVFFVETVPLFIFSLVNNGINDSYCRIPCELENIRIIMSSTSSFRTLLSKNYIRILRSSIGFMGNVELAKEAAHDSMVKAYLARESYDIERPFFPWMYRIVKNTCLDKLKIRRFKIELLEEFHADDGASPYEILHQREKVKLLRRAMLKLDPEQREIINLRHFQDLSYLEMADLLGVPKGTVMSRIFRARKQLRKKLKES